MNKSDTFTLNCNETFLLDFLHTFCAAPKPDHLALPLSRAVLET